MTNDRADEHEGAPRSDDAQSRTEGMPAAIGERLAEAAQRSGLGGLAQSDAPNGAALMRAMGGVRGLAETILPGLVFLIAYTISMNIPISLGASIVVALAFTLVRLVARSPAVQAVAGLIGVGASAVLALLTGRGSDNFLIGLFTNGGYAVAILISLVVGWPLIGLAVGYLMGDGLSWKRDRFKYRAMRILTLCWLALFIARLAVEVPFYLADNVGALALTKLLMGVPLYAPLVLLSWLVVRSVYGLARPKEAPSGGEK